MVNIIDYVWEIVTVELHLCKNRAEAKRVSTDHSSGSCNVEQK